MVAADSISDGSRMHVENFVWTNSSAGPAQPFGQQGPRAPACRCVESVDADRPVRFFQNRKREPLRTPCVQGAHTPAALRHRR